MISSKESDIKQNDIEYINFNDSNIDLIDFRHIETIIKYCYNKYNSMETLTNEDEKKKNIQDIKTHLYNAQTYILKYNKVDKLVSFLKKEQQYKQIILKNLIYQFVKYESISQLFLEELNDFPLQSFDNFTNNIFNYSKNYINKEPICWDNMVISGGSLSKLYMQLDKDPKYSKGPFYLSSDIDIYLYGTTGLRKNKLKYLIDYFKYYFGEDNCILLNRKNVIEILVKDFNRKLQIICGGFSTKYEVIYSFDMSHCRVLFDGNKFYCDNSFKKTMENNIVTCSMIPLELRVFKALHQGLKFKDNQKIITNNINYENDVKDYKDKYEKLITEIKQKKKDLGFLYDFDIDTFKNFKYILKKNGEKINIHKINDEGKNAERELSLLDLIDSSESEYDIDDELIVNYLKKKMADKQSTKQKKKDTYDDISIETINYVDNITRTIASLDKELYEKTKSVKSQIEVLKKELENMKFPKRTLTIPLNENDIKNNKNLNKKINGFYYPKKTDDIKIITKFLLELNVIYNENQVNNYDFNYIDWDVNFNEKIDNNSKINNFYNNELGTVDFDIKVLNNFINDINNNFYASDESDNPVETEKKTYKKTHNIDSNLLMEQKFNIEWKEYSRNKSIYHLENIIVGDKNVMPTIKFHNVYIYREDNKLTLSGFKNKILTNRHYLILNNNNGQNGINNIEKLYNLQVNNFYNIFKILQQFIPLYDDNELYLMTKKLDWLNRDKILNLMKNTEYNWELYDEYYGIKNIIKNKYIDIHHNYHLNQNEKNVNKTQLTYEQLYKIQKYNQGTNKFNQDINKFKKTTIKHRNKYNNDDNNSLKSIINNLKTKNLHLLVKNIENYVYYTFNDVKELEDKLKKTYKKYNTDKNVLDKTFVHNLEKWRFHKYILRKRMDLYITYKNIYYGLISNNKMLNKGYETTFDCFDPINNLYKMNINEFIIKTYTKNYDPNDDTKYTERKFEDINSLCALKFSMENIENIKIYKNNGELLDMKTFNNNDEILYKNDPIDITYNIHYKKTSSELIIFLRPSIIKLLTR